MPPILRPRMKKANTVPAEDEASFDIPAAPTLLSEFTQDEVLQESPLLTLPAELRVKIFRFLMKKPAGIDFFENVVNKTKIRPSETYQDFDIRQKRVYKKYYNLSSQTLACCQQIYQEGRHILYKENKMLVKCSDQRINALNLEINCYTMFFGRGTSTGNGDVLWKGNGRRRRERYDYHRNAELNREMTAVYPPIAAFDKVSIELRVTRREQLLEWCRALQSLVVGKEVALRVLRGQSYGTVPQNWLKICQILRCKEVTITSHSGGDVDTLCALITGNKRVEVDPSVLSDIENIYSKLRTKEKIDLDAVKREIRLLKNAMMNYNNALVLTHQENFVKAAKAATKRWKTAQMNHIEEQIEQIEEAEEETLEQIAKLSA